MLCQFESQLGYLSSSPGHATILHISTLPHDMHHDTLLYPKSTQLQYSASGHPRPPLYHRANDNLLGLISKVHTVVRHRITGPEPPGIMYRAKEHDADTVVRHTYPARRHRSGEGTWSLYRGNIVHIPGPEASRGFQNPGLELRTGGG